MAGWLTASVQLHSSREFVCDPLTPEQCDWYKHRWHYWYIADYVFALPTVAFFMCTIGIFVVGHIVSSQLLGYRRFQGPPIRQKLIATLRYLSSRGFHVESLRWNSAPVGILLLGFAGAVFFFCMDLIPQPYYWPSNIYGNSPALATRSGWMGLACMPFVFATASKTNWITLLTGVSHEKLQVFHRWISYAFFILALLHTFPFIVYHIRWHDMEHHFATNLIFYWTGIVALITQAWLTFASHSIIRNLGYEFFKASHLFAVVIFMLTFFWHCDYTLTSWDYFIATAAVYIPCYIYPWLRICFEYGINQKAKIFVEGSDFVRIAIPVKFDWKPGQHCFLRFTSLGLLEAISSHPFSICSLPPSQPDVQPELVFYIRRQGGFTARLYQHALKAPCMSVSVLVDGPYGGVNLQKYYDADHILLIAGGSGAGWCLPFVELFARSVLTCRDEEHGQSFSTDSKAALDMESSHSHRSSRPLSLRVILATRAIDTRIWFLRAVSELLSKYPATGSSSNVRIQVHFTGEGVQKMDSQTEVAGVPLSSKKLASDDKTNIRDARHEATLPGVEFVGRPQLPKIIHEDAERAAESSQSLSVLVCGPVTMQNDVRNAVAKANLNIIKGSRAGGVYLHSEHFSWA